MLILDYRTPPRYVDYDYRLDSGSGSAGRPGPSSSFGPSQALNETPRSRRMTPRVLNLMDPAVCRCGNSMPAGEYYCDDCAKRYRAMNPPNLGDMLGTSPFRVQPFSVALSPVQIPRPSRAYLRSHSPNSGHKRVNPLIMPPIDQIFPMSRPRMPPRTRFRYAPEPFSVNPFCPCGEKRQREDIPYCVFCIVFTPYSNNSSQNSGPSSSNSLSTAPSSSNSFSSTDSINPLDRPMGAPYVRSPIKRRPLSNIANTIGTSGRPITRQWPSDLPIDFNLDPGPGHVLSTSCVFWDDSIMDHTIQKGNLFSLICITF